MAYTSGMFQTAFVQGSRAALEKFALDPETARLLTQLGPLVVPTASGAVSAMNAPSGEKTRAGLFSGAGSLLGELGGAAGGATLGALLADALGNRSGALGLMAPMAIGALGGGVLGGAAGGYGGHQIARATSDAPDYMWQR